MLPTSIWRPLAWLVVFPLSVVGGCRGAHGTAVATFHESRYPEAIAEFRRAEPEYSQWELDRRAEYALYRGLTHLALGDARAAERWLGHAKRMIDRDPDLLEAVERERLIAAWRSMGHMPGD